MSVICASSDTWRWLFVNIVNAVNLVTVVSRHIGNHLSVSSRKWSSIPHFAMVTICPYESHDIHDSRHSRPNSSHPCPAVGTQDLAVIKTRHARRQKQRSAGNFFRLTDAARGNCAFPLQHFGTHILDMTHPRTDPARR